MATGIVTVGVDRNAESRTALRWALTYAEGVGSTVRAVAVWEQPLPVVPGQLLAPAVAPGQMITTVSDPGAAAEMESAARDVLNDALDAVVAPGARAHVEERVVAGDPGSALLDSAAGTDALVLGNPRRGTLAGAVTGSVALYCLHHADLPLILVPASDTP